MLFFFRFDGFNNDSLFMVVESSIQLYLWCHGLLRLKFKRENTFWRIPKHPETKKLVVVDFDISIPVIESTIKTTQQFCHMAMVNHPFRNVCNGKYGNPCSNTKEETQWYNLFAYVCLNIFLFKYCMNVSPTFIGPILTKSLSFS